MFASLTSTLAADWDKIVFASEATNVYTCRREAGRGSLLSLTQG